MDDELVFSDSDDEMQRKNNDMEGFNDFTISSSWERLIAAVEAATREWRASGRLHLMSSGAGKVLGLNELYRIQAELKSRNKQYSLEFFFQATNEHDWREDWGVGSHHLQLWFGVSDFLLISPVSLSGVVLEASEATMLLSAVAVALSNSGSIWPVFVPVHDPARKSYKGIQGTISSYSTRFEADKLCSQVPVKLMHLEGLYELFKSKVAFTSPKDSQNSSIRFGFTMKLTYGTPMPGFEFVRDSENGSPKAEQRDDSEVDLLEDTQWDEDFPWAEWYSAENPIKGFELITIWSNRYIENSFEMAEFENASTFEADKWLLSPILSNACREDTIEHSIGFGARLGALVTAFCLEKGAEFVENYATAAEPSVKEFVQKLIVPPPTVLDRVLKDLFYSASSTHTTARNLKRDTCSVKAAPPRSLFSRFCLHALWFGNCNIRAISVLWIEFVREVRWCWEEVQPLPRMSPDDALDLGSCLIHQKLQLLAKCIKYKSENITKVNKSFSRLDSTSKQQTEQEMGMEKDEGSTSQEAANIGAKNDNLLDSKTFSGVDNTLKGQRGNIALLFSEASKDTDSATDVSRSPFRLSFNLSGGTDINDIETSAIDKALEERRGSAKQAGNLVLLKTKQIMHVPHVQVLPFMTEDMLLEREYALANLDRSPSGEMARLRLQSDIIASDMAAFKAANPGAVFEDFVRWHSPRDWIVGGSETVTNNSREESLPLSNESQSKDVNSSDCNGKLSRRMSEPGNLWSEIWKDVKPIPASEQRPLFDYIREGEKVLHYLDTLRPYQLLAQMICTGFMASASILLQVLPGEVPPLDMEIDKLYAEMNISLEALGSIHLSDEQMKKNIDQWCINLRHLCGVLERIESDTIFAASLHFKLPSAPRRLLHALFGTYLAYREGKEHVDCSWKDTHVRLHSMSEREAVAESLFAPSKAGPIWKDSLRMGNFMNGHEPLYREVIFSNYEECFDSYHEKTKRDGDISIIRKQFTRRIQSHRMYICGTANDLQIAFSVVTDD